jgi:hypothetical protein
MTRRWLLRLLALGAVGGGIYSLRTGLEALELASSGQARLTVLPLLPGEPVIIPRAEWRAREPNHEAPNEYGFDTADNPYGWHVYGGDLRDVYTSLAVHHSASTMRSTTMRGMQSTHMGSRGWADIGYHFGIDPAGNIYEGRSVAVRGASVAGYNTGTMGVVMMGNFNSEVPTMPQLAALQNLTNWLTRRYSLTHLAGHREFNNFTTCPGNHLLALLDLIAAGAGLARGSGGYVPPVDATPTPAPTIQTACACCAVSPTL